ncbi:MAG: CoA transferase [Chloroflexi bacterium]|nr:CoA transferase [Chloroflexota bacterium]
MLLKGVRVLSLAQQYPGPYCTMLLADLGADVILLEQPKKGDPARAFPPFFAAVNRGKRSLTADLKSESGRAICLEVAATADVFLEGFRPGIMDALRLGHEELRREFPRLVYCSISGYGQSGPYRNRPGHDLSYLGVAGALGNESEGALHPGLAIADLSSAMFATVGILAALIERASSGVGRYVDVSMTDGLVSWMGAVIEPLLNGEASPSSQREPAYGIFSCGDGESITLSIAHEDHFWSNLCHCLDLGDLASLNAQERRDRREPLRDVIARRLLDRPRHDWLTLFDESNVPAAPKLSPDEVIQDPQLLARGLFARMPGRGEEGRWHVRNPLQFSGLPATLPRPAPSLGEHTEALLGELGYSHERIQSLRAEATV